MPVAAIAAIGVAGSIAGGAIQAHGASQAAKTQADASLQATRESNAMLQKQYDTTRADQMPWLTGGAGALGRLDYLLGINGNPNGSTAQNYSSNYGPQGNAPVPQAGTPVTGARFTPQATSFRGPTSPIPFNSSNDASTAPGQPLYPFDPNSGAPRPFSYAGAPQAGTPYGGQMAVGGLQRRLLGPDGAGGSYQGPAGPIGPGAAMGAAPGVSPAAVAGGQAPASGAQNNGDFGSLMRNFTTNDFNTDPGYQFRLSEGAKSLERSAAANGGLFSGGTLKALDQYNQNFASNEFQNAYNRFNNNRTMQYNFLGGRAGVGQQSANQLATQGGMLTGQMAQNTSNGINNAAAARASGYIGAGNALNGAIGGGMNALNWYMQNRNQGNTGGLTGGI